MQKRGNIIPPFLIFLGISLILFLFFSKNLGFLEFVTVPLQRVAFGALHGGKAPPTELEKLRGENNRLLIELAKQKEVEKENRALRDQFQTESPSARKLLPAQIIGTSGDGFTLDKGESDGVRAGDVVVVKDNLVGKIAKVSSHIATVSLITQDKTLFTGQTVKTSGIGVVGGMGGNKMIFTSDLSEKLEKQDLIRTKGDSDEKGGGFPPDLIAGQIISVNKKSSALFQVADVKSLVDFSRLEMVFIMVEN